MATKRNRYHRYSRNLEGLNAQGFYSTEEDLDASADIAAFQLQTSAVEGSLIVLAEDGTTQVGTPLTAGDKFTIAAIIDGEVKRSTEQDFADLEITKTVYAAPVIQEWVIGYNGTAGSLNITLTGGQQEFVANARDLTPANQPFPVMEGRAIVQFGTPTEYAIVNQIVKDLQNTYDFEGNSDDPFADVDVIASVAGAANATAATYQFREESNQVVASVDVSGDVTVGEFMGVNNAITSGKSWFQVTAIDGTGTIITLDRRWPHADTSLAQTAVFNADSATLEAGEYGIRFRAIVEPTNFVVGVGEDLAAADITENVAWLQGSGAPWQVASMEDETSVFAGATTINAQWKEDWGQPNKIVDPDNTTQEFDIWFLKYNKKVQSSAAPLESTEHYGYIIIAASESAMQASLDTVFGT